MPNENEMNDAERLLDRLPTHLVEIKFVYGTDLSDDETIREYEREVLFSSKTNGGWTFLSTDWNTGSVYRYVFTRPIRDDDLNEPEWISKWRRRLEKEE